MAQADAWSYARQGSPRCGSSLRGIRSATVGTRLGYRPTNRGAAPRHRAWKIGARGGEDPPLLTKQFEGATTASRLWLDWRALPDVDVETRLSMLTRWALDAHASGFEWGLRLPGARLAPSSGQAQLDTALKALALHGHDEN